MSDKPIFTYAPTYSSTDDAWADYDVLLELHADKLVGTYDAAVGHAIRRKTRHERISSSQAAGTGVGSATSEAPRPVRSSRTVTGLIGAPRRACFSA
jgi:hypothetical protein